MQRCSDRCLTRKLEIWVATVSTNTYFSTESNADIYYSIKNIFKFIESRLTYF